MERYRLLGADRSFSHTLVQLSMNMNVGIHLINRFNVGCQSVSRAFVNFWAGLFYCLTTPYE